MSGDVGRAVVIDAYVQRERESIRAEFIEPCLDLLRLSNGETPDHDALGNGQRANQAIAATDAATQLDVSPGTFVHCLHEIQIHGLAARGPVQVDDVQPLGSKASVLPRELYGIDGIAGLLIEVALEQAHTAAAAYIDGR